MKTNPIAVASLLGASAFGWKYELDGEPSVAIEKVRRQVIVNGTNACIVNGRVYGEGFDFVLPTGCLGKTSDKQRLCALLVSWLRTSLANRTESLTNLREIFRKVLNSAATNGAWTPCTNSANPSSS